MTGKLAEIYIYLRISEMRSIIRISALDNSIQGSIDREMLSTTLDRVCDCM